MEIEVRYSEAGETVTVSPSGELGLEAGRGLYDRLVELGRSGEIDRVVLDFAEVDELGTAGIGAISAALRRLDELDVELAVERMGDDHREALGLMPRAPDELTLGRRAMGFFEAVGDWALTGKETLADFYDTFTDVVYAIARTLRGRLPPRGSVTEQCVQIGVDALPIVALMSFLMGLILAFQAAHQLQQFGANIYVANLVGIAMVREFGPMMTGIIIAGRSGSSMAAELGSMKIQEEIDALSTMGIDPSRYLLVPRIFGITIVQPALSMMSMFIGIFGGWFIARTYLELTSAIYLNKTIDAVQMGDFLHGFGKSFVFAWIVGFIACYSGMAVQEGARGVGRATTRSVVASIFMLIVADSIFSTAATLM
ncbi:MAG: MlaE family lipid ABC transporter permease subunit [Bradymonadaceae bacterium]